MMKHNIHFLFIPQSKFLTLGVLLVLLLFICLFSISPFLVLLFVLIMCGVYFTRLCYGPSLLLMVRLDDKVDENDGDRKFDFWIDGCSFQLTLKKGKSVRQDVFYLLRRSRETPVSFDLCASSDNVKIISAGKKVQGSGTTIDTLNHDHSTVEFVISEKNIT